MERLIQGFQIAQCSSVKGRAWGSVNEGEQQAQPVLSNAHLRSEIQKQLPAGN